MRDSILGRLGGLRTGIFKAKEFIHEHFKGLTEAEDGALIFLREKTDVPPKLNRADIQEAVDKKDKKVMDALKKVGDYFDETWQYITKNTETLSQEQIKDYVTHIWDIPKNQVNDVVDWFATKNKFLNKRYIDTIYEGVEKFGLTPKTLKMSEIIQIHSTVAHTAVANKQFIDGLKRFSMNGMPLIMKDADAPESYKSINHRALAGYKVSPQMKKRLDPVFGKSFGNDVAIIKAFELTNGLMKQMQLSYSFFHHVALTESAIAMSDPITVTRWYADIIKGAAKGEEPAFLYKHITKDALLHGLQLGVTEDIPIKIIHFFLFIYFWSG
jgi:hypothetical protein